LQEIFKHARVLGVPLGSLVTIAAL